MGIFDKIESIFPAKPNTELYPELESIQLKYKLLEFSYKKDKLVTAIATAMYQYKFLKLQYMRMLVDFLLKHSKKSSEDQAIEQAYFMNYSQASTYKMMIEQADKIIIKLRQQRQKILDELNATKLKLNDGADLELYPPQFLHFERFAKKVQAWETENTSIIS
ncbi:MAG TPA: hypothetical protein DCS93_42635 [Microscillaceae bacterium]|nr:hypothetical protein [Microscillaceae bacterium]